MLNKNIFLGIAVLAFCSCGTDSKTANEKPAVTNKVTVSEVTVSAQPQVLTYSGSIEPDNSVSMGFSVPGRVTSVTVQEGQHVQKGQLLATIEQNTYQNNLAVSNAALEQARDNFKRLDQLYQKKSLPERDYIAAKVALTQAKANSETAAKNLRDTRLYASFSGIVTRKLTETGAIVGPGTPAFTIVKTDNVYATASITENEIALLKIGAAADVSVPSLGKEIRGEVTIINPQGDDYSRTYTVKIRLDNPGGRLLPGMLADIKIRTGKNTDAIIIPAQALIRDPDNINYVFVVKDGNTAFRKRVNLTTLTGSSNVVVSSGLQKGDKLIVSGQTNLEDGSPVQF